MSESTHNPALPMPPERLTETGDCRRVGVEVELGGLDVEAAARILANAFGTEIERITDYEYTVDDGQIGTWTVERDFGFLKQQAREREKSGEEPGTVENAAMSVVDAGIGHFVPLEIVSPPLPLTSLGVVETLISRLREAGAAGTRDRMHYAFGLQLNPELPALDGTTIRSYLQAFLCLYDWLKAVGDPDLARRITGFAEPFATDYVRKVVDPGYAPSLDELIDDYLRDNPTRNRALDLLPLFLHLDAERVRAVVTDERVKARPTLHYRLPNSEVASESWGFHVPWSRWMQVEHLATDTARLREACAACSDHLASPVGRVLENWAKLSSAWLIDPEDL